MNRLGGQPDRKKMKMKCLLVAVVAVVAVCTPGIAGEESGKIVVTPEMIRQAVEKSHGGETVPLQIMQRALGWSDRYVIPKDLLPVYVKLLKDRDPRAQRLGISGIVYFKDAGSQAVLVEYLKEYNPAAIRERFERLTEDEREKNDRKFSEALLNAALAVWALGEIGDPSVIPFLEPFADIDDMQMEWVGNPTEKAIRRIKARGSSCDPPRSEPD
jgi:hypothetical protein